MIVQKKLKHKFKIHLLFFCMIAAESFGCQAPQGPSSHPKYAELKSLLPRDDNTIISINDMQGGKNNNIAVCQTTNKKYLLRYQKKHYKDFPFRQVVDVHKQTAEMHLSPKIHNFELNSEQILMDYVENRPWPSYSFNPTPYHETMKVLKKFHDKLAQPGCFQSKHASNYWPFYYIEASKLTTNPHTPQSYMQAYSLVRAFSSRLAPWFSARKWVCHGDFQNANVLLDSSSNPLIIDLDNTEYGHPFYDVAKFTVEFDTSARMALLKTYLGEREPTQEEAEHYSIMTNIERIVDSTIRLEDLSKTNQLQAQNTPEAKLDFDDAMRNVNEFLNNTKKCATT